MGRGRSSRIPRAHKGKLIYDDIDGFWYGEKEGKLLKQRGLNVSRKNFDSVTDIDRAEQIARRLS